MISIDKKKESGIYFTPPTTINYNLELIKPYIKNIKNVLEPSCGSCEYILKLNKKWNHLKIDGIEFNKTIYDSIKKLENNNINLYNEDYLEYDKSTKYDLIIGNPPFFVMKAKDENKQEYEKQKKYISRISKEYKDYFIGRPNIFIIFIIKSLQLLNKDGILSFILPKNFLNCRYYDKTRTFIKNNFKIINIVECDDEFIDTNQKTIILIVQNNNNISSNNKYFIEIYKSIILGTQQNIKDLKLLYENSKSLNELNFNVTVGNIDWSQEKPHLTNDKNDTLLIYSSYIKDNKFNICTHKGKKEKDDLGVETGNTLPTEKKNYIKESKITKKVLTEPVLVINRGIGVGNFKLTYCLIDGGFKYIIENHLLCIKYNKKIETDKLLLLYSQIIESFKNEKTEKFIELFCSNNALNTTELQYMLPIYIND